jgi:phosphatidylserine decarboxylase
VYSVFEEEDTPLSSVDFRQKATHIPVAREGIPFIGAAIFITFISAILGQGILAWLFVIVTLFVGHFFRDPQRVTCGEHSDVVSPADGKVIGIERVAEARFVEKPCQKISVFMSVFDVHVNRIPHSGVVQGICYQKGRFLAANLAKAGRENEQNWLWMQADSGHDIVMTQVAGLIARRIVCWPSVGDRVSRGERFGMIRFGSRMDLYVPENSEILVSRGDHVCAGETILCRLR